MKLFAGKKISTGFALTLVILVFIGVTSYRSIVSLTEASNLKSHTYIVLATLERVLSQLTDAETGQRGFILTGQQEYLEPYNMALNNIDNTVTELRKLISDNPEQQRRLNFLQPLITTKLKGLKYTIDLRKNKGFEEALIVVMSGKGRHVMDDIRKVISEMVAEENELMKVREQHMRSETSRTVSIIIIGIPIAFGLLVLLGG